MAAQEDHWSRLDAVSRRIGRISECLCYPVGGARDPAPLMALRAEIEEAVVEWRRLLTEGAGKHERAMRRHEEPGSECETADILFADDDPGFGEVLGYTLTAHGYSVCHASGAKDGWARFERGRVRAVLTNQGAFRTPPGVMTGLDLAKRVKRASPSTPVVMLTAHPPEDAASVCDRVLTKGDVSVQQVIDTLQQLGICPV